MIKPKCKYCGSEKRVNVWCPGGAMCKECGNNLSLILKNKLGIPKVKRNRINNVSVINSKYIYNFNLAKEIVDINKGFYILMAIARKKDNNNITNSQEIVMSYIISKKDHLDRYLSEIKKIVEHSEEKFKIYLTYNPRCKIKAYRKLKERFLDWDYQLICQDIENKKLFKIESLWISCLKKSLSSLDYIMLDLDNKDRLDELLDLLNKNNIEVSKSVETQNGYHLLLSMYNHKNDNIPNCYLEISNIFKAKECELKRDDMLCIGYPTKEN